MSEGDYPEPDVEVPSIDSRELYRRIRAGDSISMLDLRNRDEFETWHIDGSSVDVLQVPYIEFVQAEVTDSVSDRSARMGLDEPVLAVCARGEASGYVAGLLREAGIEAANLADGMEGWAQLYVSTDLPGGSITQFVRPSSGCVGYLIHDGEEAAVVDPLRAFTDRYLEVTEQLGVELRFAIDTHVHADHLSGVREIAERSEATPVLPAGARDRGLAFDASMIDDGDVLTVGDLTIEARHLPGHTSEMTAFVVDGTVLTGDGLFLESVARPDLEAGAEGAEALARTLYDSLQTLLTLPDETRIAPGHIGPTVEPDEDGAYTATIGELRERLSILGLDRDDFVERILTDMPPRPANYQRIININLGEASVDADEGFELELGPNNCAVSA